MGAPVLYQSYIHKAPEESSTGWTIVRSHRTTFRRLAGQIFARQNRGQIFLSLYSRELDRRDLNTITVLTFARSSDYSKSLTLSNVGEPS